MYCLTRNPLRIHYSVKNNIIVIKGRKIYIIMNKPLSRDDIVAMEDQLKQSVEEDRAYWRVNDVKCDAIHTAKTYEEFADRVAGAHLRPLDKDDMKKKTALSWNQYASKQNPRE